MGSAGLNSLHEAVWPPISGVDGARQLTLPNARTALLQYSRQHDGSPLLTLFHGAKEVIFDDPRQFPFAERIATGRPFAARDAANWGSIGWPQARSLLDDLIEAQILVSADDVNADTGRHDHKIMASPLPPAPLQRARSWNDTDSLMHELTGTELDTAYLELVVPIFRMAHLFIDRDGRQIGEANVFPASARIDVPTDWRGCPYSGNRYQSEKPMNVTALRAMRVHWRQMMALLLRIREAYLNRFPAARSGWTVGDVERLTVSVLALPSYMLLRCKEPVANGDLHPALSNLFRVTDGLRMVMHQMLFLPLYEPMKQPDMLVVAGDILDYADRNFSFHSDHGVCAGPRFMIEDFLGVILDGAEPRGGWDAELDAELEGAATLIEPAMDYAMHGLRAFGAVFSLWPAMTRTYERLHQLLAGSGRNGTAAQEIAARFEGHFAALSQRSFLASEDWRTHRETVYDDMFARCTAAVSPVAPVEKLSAQIAAQAIALDEESGQALHDALVARFGAEHENLAGEFSELVREFLGKGQKIVALAEAIQAQTAALLHRPQPGQRLTLQNLNLHNVLMGEDVRTVPFLLDEIADLFGVIIHVDADTIEIRKRPSVAAKSHSAGVTSDGYPCALGTCETKETV